ncbi:MAG TPA: twin-arginine translocase TatA/TatE family subunit [Bryobacteraceae bacterium]|nr:twin-arginine translocase TatA/TatE family subunit [Bryobacteraceae bacterium]
MGPLGVPETIVIFILALLLFGPRKLPELGKTIGKAMSEFRRASSELKDTFDREMQSIERETGDLKQETKKYTDEIYNYNYDYDSHYDSGAYGHESTASTNGTPSEVGASVPQGAESPTTAVAGVPETVPAQAPGTPASPEPAVTSKQEVNSNPAGQEVKS